MKVRYSATIRFIICMLSLCPVYSKIVINEIVASNYESCFDEEMNTPDWIELYNSGSSAVNLKGWRISDADDFNKAWVLPDTLLQPGKFILIFASDFNRASSGNYIIQASGSGIATHNPKDGFRFDYIPVTGDFDISVRFKSLRNYKYDTRAGLMMRNDLSDSSCYASMLTMNPKRTDVNLQFRDTAAHYPKLKYFWGIRLNYPDGRMRLKREGDSIFGYAWLENRYWFNKEAMINLPMKNDTAYIGIAFSSSVYDKLSRLAVSDLTLNGEPFPPENLKPKDINTGASGISYYSHELHTNFKLKSEGETIYLWNSLGELIDKVEIGEQTVDVSYGREPDGSDNFKFFSPPTPENNNKNSFDSFAGEPVFSNEGGWFPASLDVTLSTNDTKADIYFTVDGSEPTESSDRYTGKAIRIDTTTVIRARIYKVNCLPSEIVNNTYFINDSSTLQIASFMADPDDLWGDDGIFTEENVYRDIEIPCHFELWGTDKTLKYEAGAGAKLHGQLSKHFPQKPLRLYAKSKYGTTIFDYPFFGKNGLKQYERILLRNGGTDWWRTILRDGFAAIVTEQLPSQDAMAFSPAIMFLNGCFYGIQNIRERIDETYISLKYKVPLESINLMEDWGTYLYGTTKGYYAMHDSILNCDMASENAYELINRNIDIDNVIDYVVLELYLANIDWPWKNLKYWNSTALDSKWRWIMNDMDYICGIASYPETDMFPMATDGKYFFSQMLPKILQNEKFRFQFINRSADLLNTAFKPDRIIATLDSLADILRPEIPRQQAKYDSSAVNWEEELDVIRNYLSERPEYFPGQYVNYFKLSGTSQVTLNVFPEGSGKIMINTIQPQDYPFEGIYFKDVPIRIKAIPNKGYKFSQWSDEAILKDTFTTTLMDFFSITAMYDRMKSDTDIVINEIMYEPHKDKNSGDWIELYNAGEKDIDISKWTFRDDDDAHAFSITENTILKKDEFLVLCSNTEDFSEIYPNISNFMGNFDFGLGETDAVRLYSISNELIDAVEYQSTNPWPGNSNGSGYSLELINPKYDNNIAGSWKSSYEKNGTPGKRNSVLVGFDDNTILVNSPDLKNYPNPFINNTTIEIRLNKSKNINIRIYNCYGSEEAVLVSNKYFTEGIHRIDFNCIGLSSGFYYCILEAGLERRTIPMVLIK